MLGVRTTLVLQVSRLAPSDQSLMLTGQTCKTQMPNTLNVKFQVILNANATIYLFITANVSHFLCFCCCDTLMCAILEDQAQVYCPSYRMSVFGPIETCSPVLNSHITHQGAHVLQPIHPSAGLPSQTHRNDLLFTF